MCWQLSVIEVVSEGLSNREKNRAKRKARLASTRPEDEAENPAKRQRVEETGDDVWAGEPTPDNTGAWPPDVRLTGVKVLYSSLCIICLKTDHIWPFYTERCGLMFTQ